MTIAYGVDGYRWDATSLFAVAVGQMERDTAFLWGGGVGASLWDAVDRVKGAGVSIIGYPAYKNSCGLGTGLWIGIFGWYTRLL